MQCRVQVQARAPQARQDAEARIPRLIQCSKQPSQWEVYGFENEREKYKRRKKKLKRQWRMGETQRRRSTFAECHQKHVLDSMAYKGIGQQSANTNARNSPCVSECRVQKNVNFGKEQEVVYRVKGYLQVEGKNRPYRKQAM